MNEILALAGAENYPLTLSGENGNVAWEWLEEGVIRLQPCIPPYNAVPDINETRVLISAGIHGNETAPIELLADIVARLLRGELSLQLNLLIVFGNIHAINQGQRYIDVDMNRLFNGRLENYPKIDEKSRVLVIEKAVKGFFAIEEQAQGERKLQSYYHFDLHTAIRGSVYPKFAVIPQLIPSQSMVYMDCLFNMGLQALVLNLVPSGTFSSFTSTQCGAISSTLELGKVKPFGENDLESFEETKNALIHFISGGLSQPQKLGSDQVSDRAKSPTNNRHAINHDRDNTLLIYVVEQELTKLSDHFTFIAVSDDVENFTAYPKGTVIAIDETTTYEVNTPSGWILFPNTSVKKGLRAGMLLSQGGIDNLIGS